MNITWKILVIILAAITLATTWQQLYQTQRFMNAGPRFTAQDGQMLCERVAHLERYSIGFQQSGIKQPPCNFAPKP